MAGITYVHITDKPAAAKTIANILSAGNYIERNGITKEIKIFDFNSCIQNEKCQNHAISTYYITSKGLKNMLDYCFPECYNQWRSCDPQIFLDLEITNDFSRTIESEMNLIESKIGLIIWTDSLWTESEIVYEIYKKFKAYKKFPKDITIYRANISEYNQTTIRKALTNLERLYLSENNFMGSNAVRKEIDLRTGAAFTRYQTMRWQEKIPNFVKYVDQLSYGSCQIPVLSFVVERYNEITAFVPETFWKLKAAHAIYGLTVDFNWDKKGLVDEDECKKLLCQSLANPKATVENVIVQVKTKSRPFPMNTAELLKLSSRKLKISFKDTMNIATQLYNKGFISNPKTGANCFSSDIDLRSLVESQATHPKWGKFAEKVLEWGPNPRNGNICDQTNPPIHPTKLPTKRLRVKKAQVYELIMRHFLACVSKDATGAETIVNINIAGEKFHANGLVIYERNYLDVYPYEEWNPQQIHNYHKEQDFAPTEILIQEDTATAPSLLTDVDLIELMEAHGIGRDGTYTGHIQKIKYRKYIKEDETKNEFGENFLKPLPLGLFLHEGYNALNLGLTKPNLRASFEKDLNEIRLGLKDSDDVLNQQKEIYKSIYQKMTNNISIMDVILEKLFSEDNNIPNVKTENIKTENIETENIKTENIETENIKTEIDSDDQLSDNSEGSSSTVCDTCENNRPTKRKTRSCGRDKLKSIKKE